jgi:hypothetical protein
MKRLAFVSGAELKRFEMVLSERSKYPSRRTYVVKLRGDVAPQALAGVVENVVTGKQYGFASAEQLVDVFQSEVTAAGSEPPIPQP